jgi:hypothetical protein
LSEDEGFAGLDADAGEVKLSVEAGEGGFDEVEFACGDASGDKEHVGFESLCEGGVEGFSGVGRCGKEDGFGAGVGDEGSQHGGVGVADFAGAGGGVDRNKFVACREDAYAGADVDVEVRGSAGGREGDLCGTETCPLGELFIATAGLRTLGYDIVAGSDRARRDKADCVG